MTNKSGWEAVCWALALAVTFSAKIGAANCTPPPAGLLGWWAAENDFTDVLGAHDAAPFGSVGFGAGEVGNAFSFTGFTGAGFVVAADTTDLSKGSVTMEAWVKPLTGGQFMGIISKPSYELYMDDFGNLHCRFLFTGGGFEPPDVGNVTIGAWNHVACTWDEATGSWQMFVAGVPVSGSKTAEPLFPSPGNLLIGAAFKGEAFFEGLIDEATIYDRALSAPEIQAIFNAGQLGKCPPLIFADGFESGDTSAWSLTVGGVP